MQKGTNTEGIYRVDSIINDKQLHDIGLSLAGTFMLSTLRLRQHADEALWSNLGCLGGLWISFVLPHLDSSISRSPF